MFHILYKREEQKTDDCLWQLVFYLNVIWTINFAEHVAVRVEWPDNDVAKNEILVAEERLSLTKSR